MMKVQRQQPQIQEQSTYAWEEFLNKNIKLRQLIFKIDNYQKLIYEKNLMTMVDLILYNDKDSQEVQQFFIEHNQNKFKLLEDFSQQENIESKNHLPNKDQRKKFFDCFKNQHVELQCKTGEKICLNNNCPKDRVMCQICQSNHKGCHKIIQIDQIIDSIQAADRKILIQNTEIHILINPKLSWQMKSQILNVFYFIQKNPNKQLFPKTQQKEFLQSLTILNHQIDLLDQQLKQPPRQIEQQFIQDIEDLLVQNESTDADLSKQQCAHKNKNSIQICFFQCNIDPIFCEHCDQLHQQHILQTQSKNSFDQVIQLIKNDYQKFNKLIQTCRFLQIYKQEKKNNDLSIEEVKKVKNKAKQVIDANDLMEVDFQIILDLFQKQKQITQTLQEKEKIIQQHQSKIIELKKKYDETLNLREEYETLTNKYKISQNKYNELTQRNSMIEKQIVELTQENKFKKQDNEVIQQQKSQDDYQQLQLKLQQQKNINDEQLYQIQQMKQEYQIQNEKLQQQQQQQKNSQDQIKQLKQENNNLNLQLEKLKQNNGKSSQKQIQENDKQQYEAKIKQLSDELLKYKENNKSQQIIDLPFYKYKKCQCGIIGVSSICYFNLNENVLLCDQCTQDRSKEFIFIFNFEDQYEQVRISHQSHKHDEILKIQKVLQIKNLQIYDPYQYLNSQSKLDQEQMHQSIQFVFAKDLLNFINIELNNKIGKLKDNMHNLIDQFINYQQTSIEYSNYCATLIQNVMKTIISVPSNFINLQETELKRQCDQLEFSKIQLQSVERSLQQYLKKEKIQNNLESNQLSLQIKEIIFQKREVDNNLDKSLSGQQSQELQRPNEQFQNPNDKKFLFILKEKKLGSKITLSLNQPIRLDIKINNKFTFYGLIIGNLVDNFSPDITIYIYCKKQQQKWPSQIYYEKLRYSKDFHFIKLLIDRPQLFEQYDLIAIYLNMNLQCEFQMLRSMSNQQNDYFTVRNESQFVIDSFVKTTQQKQEEGLIASLIVEDN